MNIETIPIHKLSHDPANVRTHSPRNIEAIKASLRRFGQQKPIVVDGDMCVRAGNGTLEAALALGWQEIAIVRSDLSGSEMTAFAIADNRTAELAEWDYDALRQTLAALREASEDEEDPVIEAVGFELGAISAMLAEADADLPDLPDGLGGEVDVIDRRNVPPEPHGVVTIMLPFSTEQAVAAHEWFNAQRERLGVTSNAEVIVRLAEDGE